MSRIASLTLSIACTMHAQTSPLLRLSLKHAVELALAEEGNAKLQIARELVVQAQTRSTQAKSALLPNLEISAGAQNLTRNLAILGLTTSTLGFPVPARVGPFSVADARVSLGHSVLDVSSLYKYRASKVEVLSSGLDAEAAAEQVAAEVAHCYLAVLRSAAHMGVVAANLELAKSLLEAAENHRRAGNATGLEVSRASLRVADEQQKLLQAQIEQRRAEMSLRRAVGLRLDTQISMTDKLAQPPAVPSAVDAIADALQSRPDWKAQRMREQRTALAVDSARAESLPSIRAFADYGATGSSPLHALGTHTAGVGVQFPVFDGSRRKARAHEAASQLRQEKARTSDLREQIQFDIEVAADLLRSASDQIAVAETAVATAQRTLEQTERRHNEGVADHVMVAEAQTELARARDAHIAALYVCNMAWIDFHRAAGDLRRQIASP